MSPAQTLRAAREYARARWRFRRLSGDALAAWQERHARAAARYARAHAPFYRALDADPARWRELPVVDKALMMSRFLEFNTRAVTPERALAVALASERTGDHSTTVDGLTITLSSGTSGNRTISLIDGTEQSAFVGFLLARLFDGVSLKKRRVAFFLRSNSNVYESANGPLVDYRYFDLTLSRDEIARALSDLQPHVLVGPPALLCIAAALVEEGRLKIAPELVYAGAEVLEPQDRARIERTFGVVVREVYHTSEGPIGLPCRAGRLHIQEDAVHVELEPLGGGRFTPIVTQLFRRVQPFLRYRMNDVVTVDDAPCPCGSAFRVLARVEGRCDDVLYFRRADGRLHHVFPDEIRRAVLAADGVREYRVEQPAPDRVRVFLDGDVDRARLLAEVHARIGADVNVELVDGIPPTGDPKKKLVRVRRLFRIEDVDKREVA